MGSRRGGEARTRRATRGTHCVTKKARRPSATRTAGCSGTDGLPDGSKEVRIQSGPSLRSVLGADSSGPCAAWKQRGREARTRLATGGTHCVTKKARRPSATRTAGCSGTDGLPDGSKEVRTAKATGPHAWSTRLPDERQGNHETTSGFESVSVDRAFFCLSCTEPCLSYLTTTFPDCEI